MPKTTNELPFNPAMPWPLLLPFGGEWGNVTIVYDQFQVEQWLDEGTAYMADSNAAKAVLDARAAAIRALPAGDERTAADVAYGADLRAWERADALRQIAYFVLKVEWPFKAAPPDPTDPTAWAAWPAWLLRWIVNTGWNRAHAAVYDPKLGINSSPGSGLAP